ncbi:hypothetical protein M433DRAFT_68469 [Acidomyces richmondensis BFW]|nr:MAG: hypothetical protein FE78DRAFT_150609 [Acidomyces sp. 'richmondensis']KYG44871.1 hypothetical protein M433DRAFT_68469 [Acidomyces richmondensis BFW]
MSVQEAIEEVKRAAEADTGDDVRRHAELLKAIDRLKITAERPEETVMRLRWEFMRSFSVRFALEYGILQIIAARDPVELTAAELSKETGADELLIIRVMRLVTHLGLCGEVTHGVYVANERTRFITRKAITGGFKHVYDFGGQTVIKVPELIRDRNLHQFPQEPDERSPFQHVFGDTMFGLLAKNPQRKRIFDDYMEARQYSNDAKWFEIYPADRELNEGLKDGEDAVLIVDVGGGKGHDISQFRQRFANLPGKLILQDLPHTFRTLSSNLEGINLMEHDFFTEQPVKAGARLYFMRSIMHDWADDKCVEILKHIVAAMDPKYSRLLIDDIVVPETEVDWLTASLDLCMWLFFSGIERTISQWKGLFDAVNLEIVHIWSTRSSEGRVIELRCRL